MTDNEMDDEFSQAIKQASDEELRALVAELFPDCLDAGDLGGLSGEFFAGMRESVDDPDGEGQLDPAQAEALGVDLAASHPLYEITGRHTRLMPADRQTDWQGSVSAVRVALPATDATWTDRRTQIGWIRKQDHLVHSRASLARRYKEHFSKAPPPIDSLELVTGARLLAFPRFAPISVLLAGSKGKLAFYAVESADVTGNPKKLFMAPAMGEPMSGAAGYSYTFMARRDNQYQGKLEMDSSQTHPARFNLVVGLESSSRPHLSLAITFERVRKAAPVRWGHFWEAVRRASAIGYPMGYHPNNSFIRTNLVMLARTGRNRCEWHKKPADSRRSACDGPYVNCHVEPTRTVVRAKSAD